MVNSRVEEYIEDICSYVRFKKAHKEIRTEFLNHIEEKTEDLMLEGMNEEEASKKALDEMGQAEIIGKQLDQSHKAAPEWSILIMTVLFSALGLVTAYLIITNEVIRYSPSFIKSIMFNIIGYITILGLYFFDYKKLEKHSLKIYIGVTLMLLIQIFFAVPVNGVKAWIPLGPISINVTELSLFLYVISLSKLLRSSELKSIKDYVYLTLMMLIPIVLYIQLILSMGALSYFIIFIMFMFNSKVKLSYIFSVIGAFIAVCFFTVFTAPSYHIRRLLIFMNPESDPKGMGWLYIQIQKLLSSAGLMGKGLNFPKGAIPEVQNDYILTYIIYTFGWIVGIVLIVLVLAYIIRMFTAARAVKDSYGRFIIQGFICIFALEFIWNILMVLGFAPIVSVGLPFISYGNSKALIQMAAIGLIMSIYRSKSLSYMEKGEKLVASNGFILTKAMERAEEKGEIRKAKQIAERMLLRRDSLEDIMELTELPEDKILELKKKLEN